MKPNLPLALGCLALSQIAASQIQNPPQWTSSGNYAGGGIVRAVDGNFYRALKTNVNHDPTKDNHTYWELYYVRATSTLTVAKTGARFSSLQQAWAMLSGATIAKAAYVTIQINAGSGTYSEDYPNNLDLNHAFGSQITIHGSSQNNVIINFPAGDFGAVLSDHHCFKSIYNLTFNSRGSGQVGLYVQSGSSVNFSGVIEGFNTGISATGHSMIDCSNSYVLNFQNDGVRAESGSTINGNSLYITGPSNSTGNSEGCRCENGSTMIVDNSKVYTCLFGYVVTNNGTMSCRGAGTSSCGQGFLADSFGMMDAGSALSFASIEVGYYAHNGGRITANGATAQSTSQGGSDFSPTPNNMDSTGAIILN